MSARPIGRGLRAVRRARAYAALAAVAVPGSRLRGPGQHAVVLLDQFHRLMGYTCPGTEPDPSLAGNEERE